MNKEIKITRKLIIGFTIICIIAVCVVIPVIVTLLTSFDVIKFVETDNDWIGFWGSYIGAFVGGLITLAVMFFTIWDGKDNLEKTFKFEKDKMLDERKIHFNDEMLEQLAEYHTLIEGITVDIQKNTVEDGFMDRVRKGTVLSKIIIIKLESIEDDNNYNYVEEVLKSTKNLTQSFNELVNIKTQENEGCKVDISKQEDIVRKNMEEMMNDIEKYYMKNK